jgi:hypothetical protein
MPSAGNDPQYALEILSTVSCVLCNERSADIKAVMVSEGIRRWIQVTSRESRHRVGMWGLHMCVPRVMIDSFGDWLKIVSPSLACWFVWLHSDGAVGLPRLTIPI